MNTKIALLVIYNHRYDKNISRINQIYAGRFEHVFHVVPFYDGEAPNVIPVYESSFRFQSYIAQAYQHLKCKGFTHYFIVADDMILNPRIDETNFFALTGIGVNQSYIYDIREIYNCFFVQHVEQMRKYRVKQKGIEVDKILPTKEEAEKCFKIHNLRTGSLSICFLVKASYYAFKYRMLRKTLKYMLDIMTHNVKIHYPLVWAYSDILLLPADVMDSFATYCGAFAATGLFVEYAIPTALVFSSSNMITDKDLKMHGIIQIYPQKRLKTANNPKMLNGYLPQYMEEETIVKQYQYNLKAIMDDFDEDTFFIHPIKLSKWK